MKKPIELISKEVDDSKWEQLIYRWVPEYNHRYVPKKKPSRQNLQKLKDRLWRELCERKMEDLEKDYKELFGELPEQSDKFLKSINKGYPAGSAEVGECFDTIAELNAKKREQNKLEAQEEEQQKIKAKQMAEKKQEEDSRKAEQEKEKRKSEAELDKLRYEISKINFSVLRSDIFTIESGVNDLLDCPELKNDAGLIEFKKAVGALQTQIEENDKQAKTAKDKTEKEQLEKLLTTVEESHKTLLEQCAVIKETYSQHSERVNPTIVKLNQTFKNLKHSTLILLKQYESSYTVQKQSVQAEREKVGIKSDEKTTKKLDDMVKTIDQNKAEIEKDIASIEKITIDEEKDTPRVKSNRISQIRVVSVKEECYRENIGKNAEELGTITRERELNEGALREADEASDNLEQLKSKKQIVKEESESSLDAVVEETKQKSTVSFWNSGEKCDKATSLQARIVNLRISITESLKEGSQGSLKATIDVLQEFIEKIKENELRAYEDAATTRFFCYKSVNNKDRRYLSNVKITLEQVKTDLSNVAKKL